MILSAVLVTAGFYLALFTMVSACGTSSPEPSPPAPSPAPIPSLPSPEPSASDAGSVPSDPKPALLAQVESLVRKLCECDQPQCTEERYVLFRDGIEGQSLEGWTPERARELHVMRARGEDCNLSMLTGGDAALLEHAREALLDSFAARAPAILTDLYSRAVERFQSGEPLPESGTSTPTKGACCAWSDGLCPPDASLWTASPWSDLGFAVTESQAFSYAFARSGQIVTVRAYGDLDCDGVYSTYELRGDVSSEPHPQIRITERLE